MARRTALITALLLLLALPAAARATVYRASARSGNVTAHLTWTTRGDSAAPDVRLRIVRAGRVARRGRVAVTNCAGPACQPTTRRWGGGYRALRVVDLGGGREPEVVLSYFWGGAHCCFLAKIFHRAGGRYRPYEWNFADPGFALRRLRRGRPPLFVTGDPRFEYEFAPYAFSFTPLRILRWNGRRLVGATRRFPGLAVRHAARAWRAYRSQRGQAGAYPLGALAGWAADEYTAGRGGSARAILRREQRHGHLRSPRGWPGGARFLRRLNADLRRWGYRRS